MTKELLSLQEKLKDKSNKEYRLREELSDKFLIDLDALLDSSGMCLLEKSILISVRAGALQSRIINESHDYKDINMLRVFESGIAMSIGYDKGSIENDLKLLSVDDSYSFIKHRIFKRFNYAAEYPEQIRLIDASTVPWCLSEVSKLMPLLNSSYTVDDDSHEYSSLLLADPLSNFMPENCFEYMNLGVVRRPVITISEGYSLVEISMDGDFDLRCYIVKSNKRYSPEKEDAENVLKEIIGIIST